MTARSAHGAFGGDFSYARMSWIKTNFLWMMYRCGWATKEGQEVVLALWLRRDGFDELLTRLTAALGGSEIDRDLTLPASDGKTRAESFLDLTPEQRIRYDELEAESTREAREARKRAAKTEVRAAGQTTSGQIIATKHTRDGYDLWITREVSHRVQIPVIASGGVGQLEHLREGLAVDQGGADAALAASIFHFGLYTISQAKQYLHEHGIPVRPQESPRGVTISSNSFG